MTSKSIMVWLSGTLYTPIICTDIIHPYISVCDFRVHSPVNFFFLLWHAITTQKMEKPLPNSQPWWGNEYRSLAATSWPNLPTGLQISLIKTTRNLCILGVLAHCGLSICVRHVNGSPETSPYHGASQMCLCTFSRHSVLWCSCWRCRVEKIKSRSVKPLMCTEL